MQMPVTFAILLPFSGRYTPPYWGVSLAALRWPSNSSHVILHSLGMKRDEARNTLVKSALRLGAKYVLFIDDDTQISGDTVMKLHMALETAEDDVVVAAGIYTSKCYPAEPYVYLEEDGAPHWKWRAGSVFPCKGIGTGCMMIKASVFEKIPEPWFRDIDTVEEARSDPHYHVHPSVGELRVTDDLYFCHKLNHAGFKILAHGGVLPVHWDQNGRPYVLPMDSYPMRGMSENPWYAQFGIAAENLVAPEKIITLPDGFLSQDEANELYDLADGKRVLEMGAFKGRSTVCMAQTAAHITSVDWHQGDDHTHRTNPNLSTEAEYRHNIRNYANVTPIVGRFEDEIPKLAGQQFDLVFVDGAHDKESVKRDMGWAMSFKPKVIAVHDWGLFEVMPAISEMGLTPTRVVGTLAVFEMAA